MPMGRRRGDLRPRADEVLGEFRYRGSSNAGATVSIPRPEGAFKHASRLLGAAPAELVNDGDDLLAVGLAELGVGPHGDALARHLVVDE